MIHTSLLFLNIGTPEMMIIFVAALLLFGGKKLPELARGLGRGIREFKDASDDVKREINNQISSFQEEPKPGTKMVSGIPVAVEETEESKEEYQYREPDYSQEQPVLGTPLAETSTVVASIDTTNEQQTEETEDPQEKNISINS